MHCNRHVSADSGIMRSLRIQLNSCCLGTIEVIVSADHSASNRKCHTHTQERSGKAKVRTPTHTPASLAAR